eukprot:TRINITY_DN34750_c0_g1_i1.p1 TRINITY_DN34750_c0_g1~~TRINITY_DN34750_c0_g1_i1.p1  ORF type:complete len:827 (+),score=159.68 TRINITY_DN34750_c0_g1_i1:89-2569(+)
MPCICMAPPCKCKYRPGLRWRRALRWDLLGFWVLLLGTACWPIVAGADDSFLDNETAPTSAPTSAPTLPQEPTPTPTAAPTAVPTVEGPDLTPALAATPECAPQIMDALNANNSAEFTRWNVIGVDINCRVGKEFLLQRALRLGLGDIAYEAAMPLRPGYLGLEVLDLTGKGMTPLLLACVQGYAGVVKKLLQLNATVSARDAGGRTVMHLGAPYTDVVTELLPYLEGGDVERLLEMPDLNGDNPLCLSLRSRASGAALKIVRQAAQCCGVNFTASLVTTPNSLGWMPVHMADRPDVFEALVEYGAELDVVDPNGATACHTVARLTGTASNGAMDYVFRSSPSCTLQAVDASDRTPLHYAAEGGDIENCRWLIRRGAEMGAKDVKGMDAIDTALQAEKWQLVPAFPFRGSPLAVLVSTGRVDAIRYVVEKGIISPNGKDPENGRTALFEAAVLGHLEIVEFLVKTSDMSLQYLDDFGVSVLAVTIMAQQTRVLKYLLERGGAIPTQRLANSSSALHVAAQYSEESEAQEVIEALLEYSKGERGQFLRYKDIQGRDPLHVAATANATKALLSGGAPFRVVDMGGLGLSGFTPMHTAALYGHAAVIEVLLQRDRQSVDMKVVTPEGFASTTAPPADTEYTGSTALHLAARRSHEPALRMLLQYCINADITDAVGRRAITLADSPVIRRILQDVDHVDGRCTCDCGPYVLSPEFAVSTKWAAGCSASIRCRWSANGATSGDTEALSCKPYRPPVQAGDPAGAAVQADDSMEQFYDEPGSWTPATPRTLSCPRGASSVSKASATSTSLSFAMVAVSGFYTSTTKRMECRV